MSDRPISVVPRYRENEEQEYEQHPVEFEQALSGSNTTQQTGPNSAQSQSNTMSNIWSVLYDYRIIIVCVVVFIIILLVAWYIFAKPVDAETNTSKDTKDTKDTNDDKSSVKNTTFINPPNDKPDSGQSGPTGGNTPNPPAKQPSVAELRAMVAQSRAAEVSAPEVSAVDLESSAQMQSVQPTHSAQSTQSTQSAHSVSTPSISTPRKPTSEPSVTDEHLASLMETASDVADEDEDDNSVTDLPETPLNPAQCSFILASGTQCKVAPKTNGRCTRHAKLPK